MVRPLATILCTMALGACKPPPEPDYEETFAGPYDVVRVATDGGRVDVSPGDGDSVTMEFLPSGSDGWTTAEEGSELVLTGVCFGEEEAGCSGGFLLTVPADQELVIDTDNGEVAFQPGLTGKLDAQTATGSITFVDSGAVDAAVLTGTGEVRAVFVEEPEALSFDSGSSLLSVALPAGRYTLDLDTLGNTAVADEIVDGNGPPVRLHSGTGDIDLFASN